MNIGNEPAHPVTEDGGIQWFGVTKRELATFFAMQGLLAGEYRCATPQQAEEVAKHAVSHADAALAKLERSP